MYHLDPEELDTLGIESVLTTLMDIGVEQLFPGIWQQRKSFGEAALDDLADSMKTAGTNVVPLIVVPRAEGGYSIIAGERRWRAAQRLQMAKLKCEVGKYSYRQALYISAVENIQRDDLNPIEEATSFQVLADEFGLSHDVIAYRVGKSRAHVSNYTRLLKLDFRVRDALISKRLTFAQARPLCSLRFMSDQRKIAEKALKLDWSVLEITNAVNKILKKPDVTVKLSDSDADLRRLERAISERVGLECVVRRSPKGQWQLGFNAPESESFSGLLERLGVRTDIDFE